MSFGDYVTMFGNDKQWKRLIIAADRKPFIKQLEQIRSLRNDVFHFRTADLDEGNKVVIRKIVECLRYNN